MARSDQILDFILPVGQLIKPKKNYVLMQSYITKSTQ